MRLINADELAIYIDYCQCCSKCNNKHFHCDDECELPDGLTEQWKRVIDEQPTVDPAKHGRWVFDANPHDGDVRCKRCGVCCDAMHERHHALYKALGCNNPLTFYRYCPNCGAKMDEVTRETD